MNELTAIVELSRLSLEAYEKGLDVLGDDLRLLAVSIGDCIVQPSLAGPTDVFFTPDDGFGLTD